jgi:Acetyltransferase (GNAT) domain
MGPHDTPCGIDSFAATDPPCNKAAPRYRPVRSGLSILTPEDLPAWDALVNSSPQCSVFLRSWWIKATCGSICILGFFENGRLIAGIPLHYETRKGVRICMMPRLTQTWGVAMAPLPGKHVTAEGRETEILEAFAARLAREHVFVQAFHPTSQNWLPFYWHGFTQTTHYTYVLDQLDSLSRLWDNVVPARRTNIRRARSLGLVVRECTPDAVIHVAHSTFTRQSLPCPYPPEYLHRIYQAARVNDSGICLSVEDSKGTVHAAYLFVWDHKRGYHLAGGHDPALSSSGGSVLLLWSLIEFAAAHTAIFDFEGSMHKQIEASFRSFGSARVGYNRILKVPLWLRLGMCAMGRPSI